MIVYRLTSTFFLSNGVMNTREPHHFPLFFEASPHYVFLKPVLFLRIFKIFLQCPLEQGGNILGKPLDAVVKQGLRLKQTGRYQRVLEQVCQLMIR